MKFSERSFEPKERFALSNKHIVLEYCTSTPTHNTDKRAQI